MTMAISPPADRFFTFMSCSLPLASVSLPTRSIAETRSSIRRSAGRGTAVDSETVVDSNAASVLPIGCAPNFLRISDANIPETRLPTHEMSAKLGLYWVRG